MQWKELSNETDHAADVYHMQLARSSHSTCMHQPVIVLVFLYFLARLLGHLQNYTDCFHAILYRKFGQLILVMDTAYCPSPKSSITHTAPTSVWKLVSLQYVTRSDEAVQPIHEVVLPPPLLAVQTSHFLDPDMLSDFFLPYSGIQSISCLPHPFHLFLHSLGPYHYHPHLTNFPRQLPVFHEEFLTAVAMFYSQSDPAFLQRDPAKAKQVTEMNHQCIAQMLHHVINCNNLYQGKVFPLFVTPALYQDLLCVSTVVSKTWDHCMHEESRVTSQFRSRIFQIIHKWAE